MALNQESLRMSSAKADDLKEKRVKSPKKAPVDKNYLTSMRNKVEKESK